MKRGFIPIFILSVSLLWGSARADRVAAFSVSPANPVVGMPVTFDASASVCSAGPCHYSWVDDADNASLGTGQTVSFTFRGVGIKYVHLTMTDALGRTASTERDVSVAPIIVIPPPISMPPPPPSGNPPNGTGLSYYVSNAGSDANAGRSPSTTWKTVAKVRSVISSFHPGDRVLFQCGDIWNEEWDLLNIHGAPGNPITIGHYGSNCKLPNQTYTATLPVLNGGGVRHHGFLANNSNIAYLTIDGFDIHDMTLGGISFIASNNMPGITIENNLVHQVGPGACSGCGSPFDNGNYAENAAIGFRDFSGGIGRNGVHILNNTVWDVGGHNTLGVHYDTSPDLVVSGNVVGPGCIHNCIDTKGVSGIISNNIATCRSQRGAQCSSADAGFYIENTFAPSAHVTYLNNVAYRIGIGFQASSGGVCASKSGGNCAISARYYNNTVYQAVAYSFYYGSGRSIDTFDIRNNIFNGAAFRTGGSTTENHNDCYSGASCAGSGDLSIDPKYVNAPNDFHLQVTSPVLGKGINVGQPFTGTAPDLGAFPH